MNEDLQQRIGRFQPELQAHAKLIERARRERWLMPPISLEEKLERLEEQGHG